LLHVIPAQAGIQGFAGCALRAQFWVRGLRALVSGEKRGECRMSFMLPRKVALLPVGDLLWRYRRTQR
jgi:hypothetical protein